MYKTEKIIKEDMVVGKNSPGSTKIFTGGKSTLEFPFTVSFMDEGEYKVQICKGKVVVNKVD